MTAPRPSLIARRLGSPQPQQAGLLTSPSYLAWKGAPRRVADLALHDAVVVRTGRAQRGWRFHGPSGVVTPGIRVRLSVDSCGCALRAACSGVDIALMPLFLCEAERASGALVRVLSSYELEDAVLWLVYPSVRYLSRPVVALRDALTRGFPASAAR